MNTFRLSSMHVRAHHAPLHGHNQRRATAALQPITARREDRGAPVVDTTPYVWNHSFEVTTKVPEKAIPTNPATASSLHLYTFHRGYRVEPVDRKIIYPTRHPRDAQLPEGALFLHSDKFEGTMAPYIVGRSVLKQYRYCPNFGCGYLLSPCVQGPDRNTDVVYLGTAQHNLTAGLRHSVGTVTPAVLAPESLVDLIDGNAFDAWRLPADVLEVLEDLEDYLPVPQPRPATVAYPALEINPAALEINPANRIPVLQQGPDIAMMLLDAPKGFPFNWTQGWVPGMKQDWLVPSYMPPEELVGSFVAVPGVSGTNANLEQLQDLYGLDDDRAQRLAQELTTKVLPAQDLVVSPGDIIAENGLYLYHRASANNGMTGSAVRSIQKPQLLLGTHIGACGRYAFNVATSVNHPVWCALYVEFVLPAIMNLSEWPAPYMPSSLAGYLQHHKDTLSDMGLWEKHAEPFVRRHS